MLLRLRRARAAAVDPSHVLEAIGVPRELAIAAVRMSLGSLTTPACVERVVQLFPALIAKGAAPRGRRELRGDVT